MSKSKRIALMAFMLALIIIFNFVPISFGPVTLGLMILPVLIMAQMEDLKMTIVTGLLLGITNLISWYTVKAGALLAPVFQNPLVCIFPRVMIGIVSYCVYHLLMKLVKPKWTEIDGEQVMLNKKQVFISEKAISVVATACGVLTNTLLVGLMALVLFKGQTFGETAISAQWIATLFSVNFVIEVIAFPIIVPAIVFALKKINRKSTV
ncbi:MAG: ECF transporter S component [Christensenellales bacterium]